MKNVTTSGILWLAVLAMALGAGCGKREVNPPVPAPETAQSGPAMGAQPPANLEPAPTSAPVAINAAFGKLTLQAPPDSQVEQDEAKPGKPVPAQVTPGGGEDFVVRLTLLGPGDLAPGFDSDASLEKELKRWTEQLKGHVIESDLPHQRFESGKIRGYYVSASDVNKDTGQYPFLVNGFFAVDGAVLMYGGVHADPSNAAVEKILGLLKTATFEKAS